MANAYFKTVLWVNLRESGLFATMLQKLILISTLSPPKKLGVGLIFLLCLGSNYGFAQEKFFTLNGQVLHESKKVALPFVWIRIPDLGKVELADSLGRFEFKGLPSGSYDLIFRHFGFDSLILPIQIPSKFQWIYLKERIKSVDAVTILSEPQPSIPTVAPYNQIAISELNARKGLNLGEMIMGVPGVQAIQTGSHIFKPMIQGLIGNRISVVAMGAKLEGQQWGVDHAPEIDVNQFDKVSLIRGSQTVRYGAEAIGGVVLLDAGDILTDGKWRGQTNSSFSSNGLGFYQKISLEKSFKDNYGQALRIGGGVKRFGNLSTPAYILGNTGMEELSISLLHRLNGRKWKIETSAEALQTQIGIFEGAHLSTPEGIRSAINRPDSSYRYKFSYDIGRPSQKNEHLTLRHKFLLRSDSATTIHFLFNQQLDRRKEFDIIRRSSGCANCPQAFFDLYSAQLEAFILKEFTHVRHQFGMVNLYQSNATFGSPLLPNYWVGQSSVYHVSNWKYDDFQWEAGFRFEFRWQEAFIQDQSGKSRTSSRQFFNKMGNIGMAYQINPAWQWRTNVALTTRPPLIHELYSQGVHHGTASFEKGSTLLNEEQLISWTSSLSHWSSRLEMQLNVFHTQAWNYIYLDPVADSIVYTIRGPFPFFQYRSSHVWLNGADLSVKLKTDLNLNFYTQGSLVRAWNKSIHDYLIFQPADRMEIGLEWARKIPQKQASLKLKMGVQGVDQAYRVPKNRDFAPPPPAYFLWNTSITYSGVLANRLFDVIFEGINLTNERYREYLNRLRYFSLEPGRNLRFKINFYF